MSDQTHCPGCGLHKDALEKIQHTPDGGWTCVKCVKRAALRASPPKPPAGTPSALVQIPCPNHITGAGCPTCGGFGVVRVAETELKTYDPASRRVLTEG